MKVSTFSSYSLAAVVLATATAYEAPTPAPTHTEPYYDEELGCWPISVEHDATYCIDGPICSGSGLEPTGSRCPVKGDVATADCHDYLASYSNGNCALPVDATCQVIKTGAWGCVLSSGGSASGEAGGDAGEGSGSVASNVTVLAAESEKSDDSISPSAVAAIAIGTGCVAAVAGFALYKQYQKHSAEAAERARLETFVDVVTP